MPPQQNENGHRQMPLAESDRRQSRLEDIREDLHSLFSGRPSVAARSPSPESPKAPRLVGLDNLPSTRIHIPGLTISQSSTRRNSTAAEPTLPRHEETSLPLVASRSASRISQSMQLPAVSSPISTIPPGVQRRSDRRFLSIDPAEQHLADLADRGRRRETPRETRGSRRTCAPRLRNKSIRQKIAHSLISGLFLVLVLVIYLALALSNKEETQEFHILLIMIILIVTIFFCHSLIRLCMMVISPPIEGERDPQRLPSMVGPGGYAETSVPIRVALARDEEAAGIESQATKVPPPAYGLWRESVRVDPNRIFWQRNEAALNRPISRISERSSMGNRPPSYMSDDGIDYVIEAAPRSTVSGEDISPRHPADRSGRHRV
ncbi:hypothetical protein sscle_03g023080 [Sclerotinia sclerotiorum 1980 UF-70]|uniref:Uncharacterized protein n=1 Tax=Sclerotinia sclerotiorum (strain ATCC 18683 / 1980 / Ss-1) TaxID=665079 RepID=A0A1D9PXU4_SCLS1|nr:hypothetical protein sscle_03g023080 [Sclerotinia sclerotiorum 1980 UF-70]